MAASSVSVQLVPLGTQRAGSWVRLAALALLWCAGACDDGSKGASGLGQDHQQPDAAEEQPDGGRTAEPGARADGGSTAGPMDGAVAVDARAVDVRADGSSVSGQDAGPESHAELCPSATPGAGIPMPVAGAAPMQLHPLVQYLESPIARPEDFGLGDVDVIGAIENQPVAAVYTTPQTYADYANGTFIRDTSHAWPDWMSWRHRPDDVLAPAAHEVSLQGSALRRGTYRITVPLLKERELSPFGTEFVPTSFDFIVRVAGIGFIADRLAIAHDLGDGAEVARSTLAGGDVPWRITDLPSWLRVVSAEGETLTHVALEFSPDSSLEALGPGHYEGRLCVENERGDAASIPVYALVEPPSLRPLHTQRFLYRFAQTAQLASYTYVFTDLNEPVGWQATSDAPWLRLARTTGMTGERIDFSVDPIGLAEGRHTAELAFSDPSGHNAGTRVVVHYVNEPLHPSGWALDGPPDGRGVVAHSPVTPQVFVVTAGGSVAAIDLFAGGYGLQAALETGLGGTVSEHSHRLFVLNLGDIGIYSVPDLTPLDRVAVPTLARGVSGGVLSVFGHEYWDLSASVVHLDDGHSAGPILPASTANRTRLRIYDDRENTVFGFHEDLGDPRPDGWVHWARGVRAICRFVGGDTDWRFRCEDQSGIYLDVLPDPHPQQSPIAFVPLFPHTGGVYFRHEATESTERDFAVSAEGELLTVGVRESVGTFGRLWGDTLLVGYAGVQAINDLFEPATSAP